MKQFVFTLLLSLMFTGAIAGSSTSTFTFQGRLDESGEVANGVFDFEFEPFDAIVDGHSLGFPQVVEDVVVQNGILTVMLDFGDALFDGGPVFLEVRAKADADTVFTSLFPRQSITATPYAIQAQFVGLNSVSSSEIINQSVRAVDVDSNELQLRVDSQCPSGQAIRAIASDGSIECESSTTPGGFWQPGDTDSLEPDRSVRIQPGTQFPFVVRHSSSINDAQISITDSVDSQPARLSFFNDIQSFTDPSNTRFWSISGLVTANPSNDRLNFFSQDGGDVLSLTGHGLAGIGTTSPQAPLQLASDGNFRWDIGNGRGDFYLGDGNVGLSMGVALAGAGTGVSRIWTKGGVEALRLGTETGGDTMVIEQGRVAIGSQFPEQALDLNGQMRIRGLSHAGPGNLKLEVEPDGDVVTTTQQTQFLALPMTAFGPSSSSQQFNRSTATFSVTGSGFQSIYAPVHLPHGARVTEVTVWFVDNDNSVDANLTFMLRYHNHITNFGFGPMSLVTSSGANSDTQTLTDNTIFANTIDNENRNYSFWIFSDAWNSSFIIRSVRITYEI